MTVAINEVPKQVEVLSPAEKAELAAIISEQTRQALQAAPDIHNGNVSVEQPLPDLENEDDEIMDVSRLNRVPPVRTYRKRIRYKYVGRLQPLPYPLETEE